MPRLTSLKSRKKWLNNSKQSKRLPTRTKRSSLNWANSKTKIWESSKEKWVSSTNNWKSCEQNGTNTRNRSRTKSKSKSTTFQTRKLNTNTRLTKSKTSKKRLKIPFLNLSTKKKCSFITILNGRKCPKISSETNIWRELWRLSKTWKCKRMKSKTF